LPGGGKRGPKNPISQQFCKTRERGGRGTNHGKKKQRALSGAPRGKLPKGKSLAAPEGSGRGNGRTEKGKEGYHLMQRRRPMQMGRVKKWKKKVRTLSPTN